MGAFASGGGTYSRLAAMGCLATIAMLFVAIQPQFALWFAVFVPALQLIIPISIWATAGLALMSFGVMSAWRTANRIQRASAIPVISLGLWTCGAGVLLSERGPSTMQFVIGIAFGVALAACAVLIGISSRHVQFIVAMWGLVAAVAALTTPALTTDRTTVALGENANGVGLLCAYGLVASLSAVWGARKHVVWGVAVAVICGFGIFASGSRGALTAALAGVGAILLAKYLRGRMETALLVLSGLAVLVWSFSAAVLQSFITAVGRGEASAQNIVSRQESLEYALYVGLHHPLTGVGLGRLNLYSLDDPLSRAGLRAHNAFAGILAESGAIAFGLILLTAALAVSRSRKQPAGGLLPLVAATLAGGVSLEWWGTPRIGPLSMLILGAAIANGARENLGTPMTQADASNTSPRRTLRPDLNHTGEKPAHDR